MCHARAVRGSIDHARLGGQAPRVKNGFPSSGKARRGYMANAILDGFHVSQNCSSSDLGSRSPLHPWGGGHSVSRAQ